MSSDDDSGGGLAAMRAIIDEIYAETRELHDGNVADYIPQLADVNPNLYGISFCGVDGSMYHVGDAEQQFCLQSCCKPLSYCLARVINHAESGIDVHKHVGYEPSGRSFNSFVLNRDGLPHNPMINAGAIMVSSLIYPDKEPAYRFNAVKKFYHGLSGRIDTLGFDNGVFLSEKHHADRNMSLAYYMRENDAFHEYPSPTQMQDSLDLYFQCCSITASCRTCAAMAATLANVGTSPITKEELVPKDVVRDCLSLMYACGMYDFSGQFSFKIGLPAKSGVSGCLLLVVPNVGGVAVWSPRLDSMGNSVRGVAFCNAFVERTRHRYHIFDSVVNVATAHPLPTDATALQQRLITAAATGNLAEVERLEATESVHLGTADYDGRTAMHLAAAEGHVGVVRYLLSKGVSGNPKDRWGNTPHHEAQKMLAAETTTADQRAPYTEICALLCATDDTKSAE
jgi:glutaminase